MRSTTVPRRRASRSRPRPTAFVLALLLLPPLCASVTRARAQEPAETDEKAEVRGGPEEGATFTEAGESGAELPEMVVEAQNEVRQQIDKKSLEFELTAAMIDSFFTSLDEVALNVSPVSGLQPHRNNLETLASDQTPHYWLPEMARPPLVTFYPDEPEGHPVKHWSLTITDFRGTPFKRFEGDGRPPDRLAWDGRGDGGEMLRAGYPYSYVFAVTDKGTNTYNYAGVSFRIGAVDYRQGADRLLEFAGGEIFSREHAQVSARGERWLDRACDQIREHPYSPVGVIVTAETQALAEARADAVAQHLAQTMILPREQIATEAIQRVDLRAELDGSVRIVVRHAGG